MCLPGIHQTACQIITIFIFCFCKSYGQSPTATPVKDSNLHLADPTIFPFKGMYYLYGTVEGNAGNGFLVYYSSDLKSWKLSGQDSGYALKRGAAYGTKGFWAPQVFLYHKKFYMAYVANENIAIAESDSPLGPFRQTVRQPLAAPIKQIDPFVFIDDDGKKYLYHVRLINGNKIFVAELNDDLLSIKQETLRECIEATMAWENTNKASWPVAEGPSVLKHKGLYYLFYTANDFRNPDYAVGYATSNSPLGPWEKYEGNPIITKSLVGENGTGHGDFFKYKKEYFYVFHTHNSREKVAPRKTAIVKTKFYKSQNSVERLLISPESLSILKK